jgi:hypothetical protein
MMTSEVGREERVNPLDSVMTKAQVVRRKFNSARPRIIQNRILGPMEAMARTMELLERLREMMEGAGLRKDDVQAGLVLCQPETPGQELVGARMIPLPAPEKIGQFVERVMALDKPLFLGVLFVQIDHDAKQKGSAFLWPFMGGPKAESALIGMRKRTADLLSKGGFAAIAE